MSRWRVTPTNLRVLLLGALGGAVWSCGGTTEDGPVCLHGGCGDDCWDGDCSATGGTGTDGGASGGTSAGGSSAGGSSAGGTAAGGSDSGGGDSGGGASTGGSGGTVSTSSACTHPEPYLAGVDTGVFRCAEGYLWRHEAVECQSSLPRPTTVEWPSEENGPYTTSTDECDEDADCPENATCMLRNTANTSGCLNVLPPEVPDYERVCWAGCRQDSDCGEDQVCLCQDDIGRCGHVSPVAGCHTDADCGDGYLCLNNARSDNFGAYRFACQLPGDECETDADCTGGAEYCGIGAAGRTCQGAAVCGRPFLIADEARIAAPIQSAAWRAPAERLDVTRLLMPADAAVRERLTTHFTQMGLLEHASVAAFARFTLQLINIGAPAELVELSQQAAVDEIQHAKLAFALASRYAGRDIGPGALPMAGALDATSLEDMLRLTVREGCIGETRAALEASRAAELCEDDVVRTVLETIAADEARHAELAWRVVRHMITTEPSLSQVLAEEFMAVQGQGRTPHHDAAPHGSAELGARRYGVLTADEIADCHRMAHRDVIGPCARTLLAGLALLAA